MCKGDECMKRRINIYQRLKNKVVKQNDKKYKEMVLKNVVEFGRCSLEMEQKREESILNQSSNVLSALALFSAIFYPILAILFDENKFKDKPLLIAVAIVTILLLCSIILVILSQWRYKYNEMADVNVFYDEFTKNHTMYKEQYQFEYQWKEQIVIIHKKLKKNNDKRVIFLKLSMVSFAVTIIIMSLFCIWLVK